MSDVFNQNWTQRMTNEVFTNKLLNNYSLHTDEGFLRTFSIRRQRRQWPDGRRQDEVRAWIRHEGPFDQHQYDADQRRRRGAGLWPGVQEVRNGNFHAADEYEGKHYIAVRPGDDMPPVQKYWSNTRPGSLYNLKYASIR